MAASEGSGSKRDDLTELLLKDIEKPIDLNLVLKSNLNNGEWGKSLKYLPPFTIKEIELHRLNSGKSPESAIIKTLDRGRKFKCERYLSADSVYTKWDIKYFHAKCDCKASMKKEKRKVTVKLKRENGEVESGSCSCPAGNSGYCNHVMALLLELADYSLAQLTTVPEEIACTSRLRQWGVPGEKSTPKSPIMETVVKKLPTKKGISTTLYDPRKKQTISFDKVNKMQQNLRTINTHIGFENCMPPLSHNSSLRKIHYWISIIISFESFRTLL